MHFGTIWTYLSAWDKFADHYVRFERTRTGMGSQDESAGQV